MGASRVRVSVHADRRALALAKVRRRRVVRRLAAVQAELEEIDGQIAVLTGLAEDSSRIS